MRSLGDTDKGGHGAAVVAQPFPRPERLGPVDQWRADVALLFRMVLCVAVTALQWSPLVLFVGWFMLEAIGDLETTPLNWWLAGIWIWAPLAARRLAEHDFP
jgi:hypothetical protein